MLAFFFIRQRIHSFKFTLILSIVISCSALAQTVTEQENTTQKTSIEDMTFKELNTEWLSIADKYLSETYSESEDAQKQDELFEVLSKVGLMREQRLQQLRKTGESVFTFSHTDVKTIKTEFFIIPTRILIVVKSFIADVVNEWSGGIGGVWSIAKYILAILMLFLMIANRERPAVIIEKVLRSYKQKIFPKTFRSNYYRRIAFLTDYFLSLSKWVSTLIVLQAIFALLTFTNIKAVAPVFHIFEAFILLKVLQVTVEFFLRRFFHYSTYSKVRKTTVTFTTFFFIVYALQYILQLLIGSSLLLSLILPFFNLAIVALSYYCLSYWREDINRYYQGSGLVILRHLNANLIKIPFLQFIFLPVLAALLLGIEAYYLIKDFLIQFDWAKKISAKILRVRLEGQVENKVARRIVRPEEYVKEFEKQIASFVINDLKTQKKFIDSLVKQVDEWVYGIDEDRTLAMYGPRGSGKTTLLKSFGSKLTDYDLVTKYVNIDEKMTQKKDVVIYLKELVAESQENPDTKYIYLIDNAHNLFLSKVGGFEGYKFFIESINDRYPNCFWVVAFNEQSWTFLNSMLKSSQYFREEFKVPRWKDDEIKKIITDVNAKLDYKLLFDPMFQIRNTHKNDNEMDSVEDKFFQLIWEQSAGNPGISAELWLNSLSTKYGKTLNVGLPTSLEPSEISSLSQSIHFVLASLLRHDNLNLREVAQVTNLPFSVVKQDLNLGREEGLVERQGERYRVTMKWFSEILKLLTRKNMIYGNER